MTGDLTSIKGVGEKRAQQLQRLGIQTPQDLVAYLPRDYLDYSTVTAVRDVRDGDFFALKVILADSAKLYSVRGMRIVTARAGDESGEIRLTWFNQPYRRMQIEPHSERYACGRVSIKNGGRALLNPLLSKELPGIVPVYHSIKGVSQRTIRDAALAALKAEWDELEETLPADILVRHTLVSRKLALWHVHFPKTGAMLQAARRRLQFEQALLYQLAVKNQLRDAESADGIAFNVDGVRETFLQKLPHALTDAQVRALDTLDADMQSPHPMNLLLQGDVGSGKTVVALYALCVAAACGYQGVLLAPTEILAQQHFEQVCALFGNAAVLLTGSMKKEAYRHAVSRIADGTALCVVGTHALMESGVHFFQLGLVVTDEQHRFGVRQRARMEGKGRRPDVLVMSATPIPRTLSLLLYGDLELATLDELPPGRKPVRTRLIAGHQRDALYTYLAEQARGGVQSFVVCPFIDEPETMDGCCVETLFLELRKRMRGLRVEKLHGRMPFEEKQAVIQAFREREIDVLVSTTLIEVGVHIPSARIMVIESAERFGLAQIHQLRGRVGRDDEQSYCFLLTNSRSEAVQRRLTEITTVNDGFAIAELDRSLRGSGDFMGIRQHGEASIPLDEAILLETRGEVQLVLESGCQEYKKLMALAAARFGLQTREIVMN